MKNFTRRILLVISMLMLPMLIPAKGAHAAGFTAMTNMSTARTNHTATLLGNGKILIVGGIDQNGNYLQSAVLLDPATGQVTATTGTPNSARANHAATMLPNGMVLITGGASSASGGTLNSAELYDPSSDTFSLAGYMNNYRQNHTATLLMNGNVLIAGGASDSNGTAQTSAEIYNPSNPGFYATASMSFARQYHTATLLRNGSVLLAGGSYDSSGNAQAYVEIFDPNAGIFIQTASMNNPRQYHTASLLASGKVLIAGGSASADYYAEAYNTVEIFDPNSDSFTSPENTMLSARAFHAASLLPDGTVLLSGGTDQNGNVNLTSVELFHPNSNSFSSAGNLGVSRQSHAATIIPGGKVIFTGGTNYSYYGDSDYPVGYSVGLIEAYNPASGTFTSLSGTMSSNRIYHTSTMLPSGLVLVAGGTSDFGDTLLNAADLYDPAAESFTPTGGLQNARYSHTATLLPNGQVLIAGGTTNNYYVNGQLTGSAEVYDPYNYNNPSDGSAGTFTYTGEMQVPRYSHNAALLSDGTVLIFGGYSLATNNPVLTPEIYNNGSFRLLSNSGMQSAHIYGAATSLADGTVLITGNGSAEIYNPALGTFSPTNGTMMEANRRYHTATLLPNGKVLIAGGDESEGDSSYTSDTAELYDPVSGTFAYTNGDLNAARSYHTATLLPNGMVLLAGGDYNYNPTAELYDPASDSFILTGAMTSYIDSQTATLLTNGNVLLAGGEDDSYYVLNSAQVYNIGLNTANGRSPTLSSITVNSPGSSSTTLTANGTQFLGDSEASGSATNNSAANYPLLQLLRIDNGYTSFLRSSDSNSLWTNTSLTTAQDQAATVAGLPSGYYLASLFVNGMESSATSMVIQPLLPSMSVSPSGTINFSVAGGSSQTNQVTIYNYGIANLTVRSISLTGGSDFSVTGNTCSNSTPITTYNSCAVTVKFSPTGTETQSATLTIASSDPQNPTQSISLAGTGLQTQSIGAISFSPATLAVNGTTTASASATSGIGVTFSTTTPSICSVSGTTVTGLASGTCTIAADQSGNGTYAAATEVTQPINITPATQTVSFSAAPSLTYGGAAAFVSASATSGLPVTYSTSSAACSVNGSTGAVTPITAGSCVIAAVQSGNANYSMASATQTINIAQAIQSIGFGVAPSLTYGGATGAVSASATSGLPVTYSTSSAACSVNSSTGVVTPIKAGSCVVAADQPGNGNYAAATEVTQLLTIAKAVPVITWATPAAISYGTPLSTTQLNATSGGVAGTFAYTPASGTILASGAGQTLSATFTPSDAADYATQSATVSLTVNVAAQSISFGAAPSLIYGGAAGLVSASATSGLPVTYSTSSSACSVNSSTGAVTPVTAGICTIAANQVGNVNYSTAAQVTQTITVAKAVPVITWTTPAAITYGTSLSGAQLNAASGGVTGTFTYTPASGTILASGAGQTLSATFTPSDATDYATQSATVSLTVNAAAQSISFGAAPGLTFGGASGTVSASNTSGLPVSFSSLTPAVCSISSTTVTPVTAGTCIIAANAAGNGNYTDAVQATQTISVAKAVPVVIWANPVAITYGTPLSATQLNATSGGVAGTFVYTPASGTTLTTGAGQILSATFTPSDVTDYATQTATALITVNAATQSISFGTAPSLTYGGANGSVSASATSGLAVMFSSATPAVCTVSGNTVTPVTAGTCIIAANQAGNGNFTAAAPVTQNITIAKATPVVTWATPAAITYGTPLSGAQLNAASGSVNGTFVYSPAAGTVLSAGTQTLYATFTPNDTADYNTQVATTTLTVNSLASNQVVTGPDGKTTIPVTISVTGSGATLTINAGTLLSDVNGNPISGTLSIAAAVLSNISALPAGAITAQTADGLQLNALGNAIDITISVGTSTVKTFSPEMVVNLPIPSTFAASGATVSFYSYDGTTWHLEGSTIVKADGSIDMPVSHLSIWAVAAFGSPVNTNAPVISAFAGPTTSATLAVSGITIAATDNVGVTGYLVSESAVAPLASDPGWTATPPTTYTCALWGNCTLYAYAKDAAGNVSASQPATVLIGPTSGVIIPAAANAPPKLVPTIADALMSLNFAMKVATPTATQFSQGKVAPLVNGIPDPDPDRATLDLGDTIVILRRVVGLSQ